MRAVGLALVALLAASLAAPSATAHHGKGKHARPTPTPITTTYASPSDIARTHDTVCLQVVEFATCSSLDVTVDYLGTGPGTYVASSGPAAGTVTYNASYSLTTARWAQTVSHEAGGHHDAWAELVAKVGINQAWTDYYDLDVFGEPWAESRFLAAGQVRDVTRHEGKEIYLDCAGPVEHGYSGNYLTNRGIPMSDQPRFCQGHETVMTQALG